MNIRQTTRAGKTTPGALQCHGCYGHFTLAPDTSQTVKSTTFGTCPSCGRSLVFRKDKLLRVGPKPHA